jgi:hypothetical protein
MSDGSASLLTVQSVAYAGLDVLLSALPLDLCAYLHVGEQLGPQLYLRRPTLSELDPADAFRLFSSLRDLLDAAPAEDVRCRIEDFEALIAVSAGRNSRGLWVAGRHDEALGEDDGAVVTDLGRAIMGVCHAAETTAIDRAPSTIVRVTVETSDTGMRAEVAVDHEGREVIGQADAPTALAAVAWATLEAVDPSLKLVAADEDGVDDTRVVLVLVRDATGRSSVGASLADGGPLRAAAAAALVAVSGLPR